MVYVQNTIWKLILLLFLFKNAYFFEKRGRRHSVFNTPNYDDWVIATAGTEKGKKFARISPKCTIMLFHRTLGCLQMLKHCQSRSMEMFLNHKSWLPADLQGGVPSYMFIHIHPVITANYYWSFKKHQKEPFAHVANNFQALKGVGLMILIGIWTLIW